MDKKFENKLINEFEIQVNVKNEEDLYNCFDVFNKTLSDNLYSYIIRKIEFANYNIWT